MLELSADDASQVGVALHGVSVGNRPVHSHLSAFHLIFAGTLSSAICCRARVLTVSVSLEALRRRGAAPQQVPKVATTGHRAAAPRGSQQRVLLQRGSAAMRPCVKQCADRKYWFINY